MAGGDRPHRPRHVGVGVLHRLRLVEHEGAPRHLLQSGEVAGGDLVRGDHQIVAGDLVGERGLVGAACAVVDHHPDQGGEAGRFGPPVAHHRQGADDEVWSGQPGEVGEGGGCLAEAHVIGEASTEAKPVEELEPPEAALLVRAQGGGESGGHLAVGESGVG